jgi:bacterial/archaeal transporter family protein
MTRIDRSSKTDQQNNEISMENNMIGWLPATIATFFIWGMWGFLPKISSLTIDHASATVYQVIGALIVGIGLLFVLKFKLEYHPTGTMASILGGALGFVGMFTFLYALRQGPMSSIISITALYPALVLILGFIILREPISIKQGIGILTAMGAMYLISS